MHTITVEGTIYAMMIKLSKEEQKRMIAAFRADEDCEENGDGSFTVDLYEPEPAVSIELYPEEEGFVMTAAVLLAYSEEMQGYYLAERIKDEAEQAQIVERIRAFFLNV